MLMGRDMNNKDISFDIECQGRDLDRKVKCQMYEQPLLKKWGIFFQERDSPSAAEFQKIMARVIEDFGYPTKGMASFKISGHNIELWK